MQHGWRMEILVLRRAAIALVAAACLPAGTAAADVVSGTVVGTQPVAIRDAGQNIVAQLNPGPYEIILPVGRYSATCGNGQPASPPEFLGLSSPVTVNFTCR